MTTEHDAIEQLRILTLQSKDEPEAAHAAADTVLCALLTQLGYAAVVYEWRQVNKWYA